MWIPSNESWESAHYVLYTTKKQVKKKQKKPCVSVQIYMDVTVEVIKGYTVTLHCIVKLRPWPLFKEEDALTSAVIQAMRCGEMFPHSTLRRSSGFFWSFRLEIRLRRRVLYFMSVDLNSWKICAHGEPSRIKSVCEMCWNWKNVQNIYCSAAGVH